MRFLVAAISIFMVAVGLYGVVSPAGIRNFVKYWQSTTVLWVAAALRLVYGVALWAVAPSSRAPVALQLMSVVTIAAGILLPLMGYARYESLLVWWQRMAPVYVRLWCFVAGTFGAFILWAMA